MWEILRPLMLVVLWDLMFLIVCCLPLVALSMVKRPAYAVLKRNFIGYFMNPTGYAFLVLFVFLCSLAQFWPHAFFNANMATLDQLSTWFPLIMLSFIPAITMSIWADERRQGTDELLLTIPANDFDIVIGKYLSTASIFTVSLLFSQLTILFLLDLLSQGQLDVGLFLSTYLGYWLVGLAMLALGMVGSFLTSNITIGFMLAALLNVPLVAAAWADAIVPTSRMAQFLSRLSIAGQLEDFESGVISLSSTSYFVMLIVLGLFLSMVLIGRRHWMGGHRGAMLALHFTARALCLVAILVGVNLVFAHYDVRPDLTEDQVNRLHDDTLALIDTLDNENAIVIEAYVSQDIPEMYAPTARDLVTLLREIDVRGGDRIEVRLHQNISVYSDEAVRAGERYGIEPQTVATMVRGAVQEEEIILGAAITMGLDQQVIPFFSNGIPPEYELIRSIMTLAQGDRKTIGVVKTDAQLMGGISMSMGGFSQVQRQMIIDELQKQYNVEEVDPAQPIDDAYDVLLVVQPSSLTQSQIGNLVDAIARGIPTAIFEDPVPFPGTWTDVPGTDERRQQGGMMGMSMRQEPKGSLQPLWDLLGVEMVYTPYRGQKRTNIVWQQYNPYPQIRGYREINEEWVFVRQGMPEATQPFNPDSPVTGELEEILFIVPGGIAHREMRGLEFIPLVRTGKASGIVFSDGRGRERTERPYVLAAQIKGRQADTGFEDLLSELDGGDPNAPPTAPTGRPINVIMVSDIDVLATLFLQLRAQPNPQMPFRFDNVTFVLNIIDELAGDDRFIDIRTHKRTFATLKHIEERIQESEAEQQAAALELELRVQALQDEARAAQNDAAINMLFQQVESIQKVLEERETERASRGDQLTEEEQESLDSLQGEIAQFAQLKETFQTLRENMPEDPDPEDPIVQMQQQQMQGVLQDIAETSEEIMLTAQRTGLVTENDILIAVQRASMQIETASRQLMANLIEEQENSNRQVRRIETQLQMDILRMQRNYKLAAVIYPILLPMLIGLVVFIYRRMRENEGIASDRLR